MTSPGQVTPPHSPVEFHFAARAPASARLPMRARRAARPYWTVAIAVVALLGLSAYPVVQLVWLSLHNVRIAPAVAPEFIGLTQYGWILQDIQFWNSLRVTAQFVVCVSSIELILGFGIALLLNFDGPLVALLRMLFLLPTFLAPVVVALVWGLLLNAEFGLAKYVLGLFSVDKQAWLSRPDLAFGSLVVADVWQWTPFMMLLILGRAPEPTFRAVRSSGDRRSLSVAVLLAHHRGCPLVVIPLREPTLPLCGPAVRS